MKKILIPFLMLFSCQSVFAISGKDAKTYMKQEPQRQEYARNVSNATEKNLSQIRNSSSGSGVNKSIISQINSSATVSDGSKVTGGATVTKPVDPKAVAKTMVKRLEKAKALGKASLPSFLGSAALTALVQSVGWVIDHGGEVKKLPEITNPDDPLLQYYWALSLNSSVKKYASPSIACNDFKKDTIYKPVFSHLVFKSDTSVGCYITYTEVRDETFLNATYYRYSNPYYNSSAPQPGYTPVSSSELENVINNYITNNDNSVTNNIINNSYSYDNSNGATPNDETNTLVNDVHKDLSSAIDNASTAPYNADKPKQGYYIITDGSKTIEGYVNNPNTIGSTDTESESTTVTNPDGSTTTTGGSQSEFQLPAFCEWASIMCDWYEDFKEFVKEDDQDDEQSNEPDTSILDREFDTNFNMSGQCPPDPVIPMPMGLSLELPFSKICDFFSYLKFGVITAASLLSGWILYGAVNKGAE